jgi:PST family polysaccharide transporter
MGLPLLALPFLAQRLGTAELGRLAFAISVAQVMLVLTDYGFNLSASKAVSVHRDDKAKISELWVTVTMLRALFAVAGLVVVILVAGVLQRFGESLGLILVAYTAVLGNILFPQWLFQGLERLKLVSIIQVITRFAVFACLFVFVKQKEDVYLAVFFQSAGLLLGGLVALPYTLRALRGAQLSWPSRQGLMRQLKEGWHVFVSTALTNVYTQGNAMFLGAVAAPQVVGQFYIAERLIRAVQLVYAPVSNSIYPHIARLVAADRPAALAFIGKVLRYSGGAGLFISVAIFLIAPVLVPLVFGPAQAAVGPLLQIFSPLPFILMVSNTLAIQTMLPLDLQSRLSRIYLCAALLNLAVFVPMSYYAAAYGAVVANLVVEAFIVILLIRALNRANLSVLALIWPGARAGIADQPIIPPSI